MRDYVVKPTFVKIDINEFKEWIRKICKKGYYVRLELRRKNYFDLYINGIKRAIYYRVSLYIGHDKVPYMDILMSYQDARIPITEEDFEKLKAAFEELAGELGRD